MQIFSNVATIFDRNFCNELTTITPMYGDDIVLTKHEKLWSMDNLKGSKIDDACTGTYNGRKTCFEIQGVNSSMFYIGAKGTTSSLHLEDGRLMSISYLYNSKKAHSKFWLIFHGQYLTKLADRFSFQCPVHLSHKSSIVDTDLLKELTIPYEIVEQKPGDFILTTPNCVHQVVNSGPNIAIAINFAVTGYNIIASSVPKCSCGQEEYDNEIDRYQKAAMLQLEQNIYSHEKIALDTFVFTNKNNLPPAFEDNTLGNRNEQERKQLARTLEEKTLGKRIKMR